MPPPPSRPLFVHVQTAGPGPPRHNPQPPFCHPSRAASELIFFLESPSFSRSLDCAWPEVCSSAQNVVSVEIVFSGVETPKSGQVQLSKGQRGQKKAKKEYCTDLTPGTPSFVF